MILNLFLFLRDVFYARGLYLVGRLNLNNCDVLRVLLRFGTSTDGDFGRKDNVAKSPTLVSGPFL